MDGNELIHKFDSYIKMFAYKYCRHKEDLKDFEQELRIRLWKAYETHFDEKKGKLNTWVYQTLLLHSRKLRFEILRQDSFEKEVLNSDYYNNELYCHDQYFICLMSDLSVSRPGDIDKFLKFEKAVNESLSSREKVVYNHILRNAPSLKLSRIAKEIGISKSELDSLYSSIKSKVSSIYKSIYYT